jgi:hypothetical protein
MPSQNFICRKWNVENKTLAILLLYLELFLLLFEIIKGNINKKHGKGEKQILISHRVLKIGKPANVNLSCIPKKR